MSVTERVVNGRRVQVVRGDITHERVGAIVNAANEGLCGGGGVDGAIHRAGGPAIMEACRAIGGCRTGDAVATAAGLLPAKYVFHAVGPVYRGGASAEADQLASCYRRCMELGDEVGVNSIAFPAISCGVYGYPIEDAARVAIETVVAALSRTTSIALVRFVLFSEADRSVYARVLEGVERA